MFQLDSVRNVFICRTTYALTLFTSHTRSPLLHTHTHTHGHGTHIVVSPVTPNSQEREGRELRYVATILQCSSIAAVKRGERRRHGDRHRESYLPPFGPKHEL